MRKGNVITFLRGLIARKLDVEDQAASNGDWWEIDLIIVLLLGSVAVGIWAFLQL